MLLSTADRLVCPAKKTCAGRLGIQPGFSLRKNFPSEVEWGELQCQTCQAIYPILSGVAIIVPQVRNYLLAHVKGISKFVDINRVPKIYRKEFSAHQKQIASELYEEDLESDRVNALYLMNHYLAFLNSSSPWWKPDPQHFSPLIENLIAQYWDKGPFQAVKKRMPISARVVELGCGVGGLARVIASDQREYLGIDNTFQSIVLARQLNLGIIYQANLKIPGDLLHGGVSQTFPPVFPVNAGGNVDFVVGEIEALPLAKEAWDCSIAMNAIDMLEDPRQLAQVQFAHLSAGGSAIQTGPYIWNERVAARLRSFLPKAVQDSASAVEWIYEKAGFEIIEREDHVPWLFFKHARQIELYSVHVFRALKK